MADTRVVVFERDGKIIVTLIEWRHGKVVSRKVLTRDGDFVDVVAVSIRGEFGKCLHVANGMSLRDMLEGDE